MVTIYLVFPRKFYDLAFSLFVQCSMYNAGSMLHCLNKANFRLFIVLSAVTEESIVKLFADRIVACVASVSVRFGSKELQRENGASKRRGRERGRKDGNACLQTPGF